MDSHGPKILVADDSIVSRHILDATLRKWGYEIVLARDGVEAWSILNADPDIRLAILDWVMPGMTGPEVCRKLRAELDANRYVYAIMLTSKSLKEHLLEGLESGADEYLTKPFDQHELRVRIRTGFRILARFGASLPVQPAVRFYSCFISHSSRDDVFVSKLHADLIQHGITCWYAPEDLKIGDRFRMAIDESIRIHDKLLLVLSESSIGSPWVESEVETALVDEQRRIKNTAESLRGNITVLFPVRIDDTPFAAPQAWVGEVRRTRHIGDFRLWSDPEHYQRALKRLLRDLATSDELDRAAVAARKRMAEGLDNGQTP